ncbi:MAG: esterase/lipase family protein [Thermodesulforhabdaceae bacterium]|jgi:pimeloyl-ACP methyl ester carboxylesterase
MEALAILVFLVWLGIPLITYAFYWYEHSTPSCLHPGAKSEREVIQKLVHRDLRVIAFSGLVSSIVALPIVVILYPFGFISRWWSVRKNPSAGTIIFIHGLFHNPSAALLLKTVFSRRGYSFISLRYQPFKETIFSVLEKLERDVEKSLRDVPKDESVVLIGHSLGGILAGLLGRKLTEKGIPVKGVIAMGTPFKGSRLAIFARCSLGGSLRFGNPVLRDVRKLLESLPFPAVQIWSTADNMVFPISSLYEVPEGWDRVTMPPVCHTGMVFWPGLSGKISEIMGRWL